MIAVKISFSVCINEWILTTKLAQKDCWKKTKSCRCSLDLSRSDSPMGTNGLLSKLFKLYTFIGINFMDMGCLAVVVRMT